MQETTLGPLHRPRTVDTGYRPTFRRTELAEVGLAMDASLEVTEQGLLGSQISGVGGQAWALGRPGHMGPKRCDIIC